MIPTDPFTPPEDSAIIVGTGRLTLDVIVHHGGEPTPPRCQAGGTCGNVLANLSYLGWQAHPLTDLGDDDSGTRLANDLERWDVRLDLVRRLPGGQTPMIVHHICFGDDGVVHSFSSRCPFCGEGLKEYEPVSVERVRERLPKEPPARVVFFDRDSEGALLLARHCREQGAIVAFEPNYVGRETLFPQALEVTHILKYARDTLPELEDCFDLSGPVLLIETLGAQGLRYCDRRHGPGEWQHLPAVPAPVVRDAAGTGDWCMAGLLHRLGQSGLKGLLAASPEEVQEALRFGQALAAWGCAFEGARGALYHDDRATFLRGVMGLLAGTSFVVSPPPMGLINRSSFEEAGAFCPRCGGEGVRPPA
jgi:fructokinase